MRIVLETLMAQEAKNPFLPEIADLIWGTVSFAIIFVAVYKLAWPTFMRVLDERGQRIDEGLRAADLARQEVDAERARLEDERNAALREAADLIDRARANAAEIVADAHKDATAERGRILEAAGRQIAADTETARRSLQSEVGSLASELASRIVGAQAVDENISRRVVDAFLDELEASTAAKVNGGA